MAGSMFTGMGRKPKYAMIDNVPTMVKKPVTIGKSIYVCVPKELISIWELKGDIKYFTLDIVGNELKILPCYEDVEVGTL